MDLEKEIFKRYQIDVSKLVGYGFRLENSYYVYEHNILDDTFKMIVTISPLLEVKTQVFDLEWNEEYANFRIGDQNGEFVNRVREEITKVLVEIRDKCAVKKWFVFDQANRITSLIIKKYGDEPLFLWKTAVDGVFKNAINDKWYGLIMFINRCKIGKASGDVEILNIKLDEDLIAELLKREGFYKAYHMNKKKWITISLDDTISDEEIMALVDKSHCLTMK